MTLLLASTPSASAYWVCPPTSTTWYEPNGAAGSRCHGNYNGSISYVQKRSYTYTSYAVYVASCYGCAGTDYYDGNEAYLKNFGCAAGYPGGHNRHSVRVKVEYTLAGSC